jgi:hypothetical protein
MLIANFSEVHGLLLVIKRFLTKTKSRQAWTDLTNFYVSLAM